MFCHCCCRSGAGGGGHQRGCRTRGAGGDRGPRQVSRPSVPGQQAQHVQQARPAAGCDVAPIPWPPRRHDKNHHSAMPGWVFCVTGAPLPPPPHRFDGVLAMRQAHGFAFGKSDFFFVVALKPEPGQQVGMCGWGMEWVGLSGRGESGCALTAAGQQMASRTAAGPLLSPPPTPLISSTHPRPPPNVLSVFCLAGAQDAGGRAGRGPVDAPRGGENHVWVAGCGVSVDVWVWCGVVIGA